jgi:hypothetical protein
MLILRISSVLVSASNFSDYLDHAPQKEIATYEAAPAPVAVSLFSRDICCHVEVMIISTSRPESALARFVEDL